MDDAKITTKSRMKARLRWGGCLLLLCLCYWWVMADFVVRDFWDPQYGRKAERLRALIAEHPARPLWVIIGSSHVDNGLRSETLPAEMRKGNGPVLFNFGMGGADIFRQMLCLQRLVKDGMKPQRVGIEVNANLSVGQSYFTVDPRMIVRARPDELPEYRNASHSPARLMAHWLHSRINPICQYGMGGAGQTLPWRLIPAGGIWRRYEFNPLDEWGWNPGNKARRHVDYYHAAIKDAFRTNPELYLNFKIAPRCDRDLRQIIAYCQKEGIALFLLRMPQSVDYQALYTEQAVANLQSYLDKIQAEYGLEMVDARSWVDPEGFSDGRHLNGCGATLFTRRFAGVLFGKSNTRY